MGKRQTRLYGETLSAACLSPLLNEVVEVVLRNGRTFTGQLTAAESAYLTLRGINAKWYNRKRHTHRLFYINIEEVVHLPYAPH